MPRHDDAPAPVDDEFSAPSGIAAPAPRTGTTGTKQARSATKSAPRTPTVVEPRQQSTPATTPPASSAGPTPAASHTTAATADAAMVASAAGPLAMVAMSTLNSIAGNYGDGAPTTPQEPMSPPVVGTGAPTGPIAWDSAAGVHYTSKQRDDHTRTDAMGSLNNELRQLLGGAADDTVSGRAAIASIIAEADTALTALGAVGNTPAAQQQVIGALDTALQRAGAVLGRNRMQSIATGDRIAALAARYVQNSSPKRAVTPRYVTHGSSAPGTQPSGTVGQWINTALRTLSENGYDTSRINPADIATIIQHESAGNPHAFNGWDSNAAAGTPSKGLMQTIDPTFNAYALPGHTDIWNPVDNIIAGVRYAIHRYGSVSQVPGVVAVHHGGGYVGY